MSRIVVATLYRFVKLRECAESQSELRALCQENGLLGTLILASEGINGTIAGSRAGVDRFREWLSRDVRFADAEYKESITDSMPFYRLKVVVKGEIVTMRVPGVDVTRTVGPYVSPQDWNSVIRDPEVVVIDCRNHFEVEVGRFAGSLDPQTEEFRGFPEFVRESLDPSRHSKIAMYCTGGIRCEKASSFMLGLGFASVRQLKGGILSYLEQVPMSESLWQGECFVFDQRVSLGHGLTEGSWVECHGCKHPVSPGNQSSPRYIEGVACPECHDQLTEERAAKLRERSRQIELAANRGGRHIGFVPDRGDDQSLRA